jgi:hypothetical protein
VGCGARASDGACGPRHDPAARRLALGLTAGGLAAATAGLLAFVVFRHHVADLWLAFLGMSMVSLVAGTVFGFVTASPRRSSA